MVWENEKTAANAGSPAFLPASCSGTWPGSSRPVAPWRSPGLVPRPSRRPETPAQGASVRCNAATLFPAEQYTPCPQAAMGLSYNWAGMNNLVNNMTSGGNTNQAIGLVLSWQSLVGGGPFAAPPAMDPNYISTSPYLADRRVEHAGSLVRRPELSWPNRLVGGTGVPKHCSVPESTDMLLSALAKWTGGWRLGCTAFLPCICTAEGALDSAVDKPRPLVAVMAPKPS
jgi:hypothetical protein